MRIYTRFGDTGKTRTFDGKFLAKSNQLFEVLGNLDELNSYIGLAISFLTKEKELTLELLEIQHQLFDFSSDLQGIKPEKITSKFTRSLEKKIDKYSELLPELNQFILPNGQQGASILHICRTIARRTERHLVLLNQEEGELLKFINRLSDYFFTLARIVNKNSGVGDIYY